jgi:hypothetical protein
MRILKIEPEYHACFFWKLNDEGWFENFDGLPGCTLSAELEQRVEGWCSTYNSTYDSHDPRNSAFPSPAAEGAWERQGLRLRDELACELGAGWRVFYARPRCLQQSDRCDLYLDRLLPWEWTRGKWLPLSCRAHGRHWNLEINTDSRRPVFALQMDGRVVREFDHWPACWK